MKFPGGVTGCFRAAAVPQVMKLEVLEKEDCEKLGMGCFLGVAEASAEPPKFIHLTYTPPSGEVKRKASTPALPQPVPYLLFQLPPACLISLC